MAQFRDNSWDGSWQHLGARGESRVLLLALVVLAAISISLTACHGPDRSPERRYRLKGKIVSIDKQGQRVVVDHEAIPGFMSAMTMSYRVKDAKTLDQLMPGDPIQADVVANDESVWLENVVVVKGSSGTTPPPNSQMHQPQPGEQLPDLVLVSQDGKRIHLLEYRGKVLLVTFIYTRCPLPDYCPRMSKNFSQIEAALARDKKLYSKTHLLSISFDPAHDTPAVLRRYASDFATASTRPGFEHWGYAVAPAKELKGVAETFGLFYSEQDDQIAHSMSTTVISPDGKVYKWYHDNAWNPEEVLADVKSLLASETSTKAGGKVDAPKIRAAVAGVPSK